jgi:autotransporter-associated beta strand protein
MLLTWCRQLVNRKSQAVARSQRAGARRKHGYRPRLERLETRLAPALHVWSGANSELWSDNGNWGPTGSPYSDSSPTLEFPANAIRFHSTADGPLNSIFGITFNANGFLLDGGPIQLGGVHTTNTSGSNTFDIPVFLLSSINVDIALGGSLIWTSPIAYNILPEQGIQKLGEGTLILSGSIQYRGAITINGGELILSGNNTYSGGTNLNQDATLTVGNDHALGTGPLTMSAALIQSNADVTLANRFIVVNSSSVGGTSNLTFSGDGTLDTDAELILGNTAGTIRFSGRLDGPGRITQFFGRVVLSGNNTFSGGTGQVDGSLRIDGIQLNGNVNIGGILGGKGTVGTLSVDSGGTVWPSVNDTSGADFLQSGSATFSAGSSFQVNLNAYMPNGYDQLAVDGTVDLSGSPTLNASLNFTPNLDQRFTIISSSRAITGTFAGLPDGAIFDLNGTLMQINYTTDAAGRGFVVLTNLGPVPPPGPPAGQRHPAAVARFPGDAFPLLAGPDAALTAAANSDAATTGATTSPRPLPPVLDVAGVDLFFAAGAEPDDAFGWPRSKRDAWLGADDWWVTDLAKDGSLVESTLWALPTA